MHDPTSLRSPSPCLTAPSVLHRLPSCSFVCLLWTLPPAGLAQASAYFHMATIVHIHWVARWYEVNMVSAILLDNVEDTRTITVSVEDFLKLDFADTEDNTRKIKQIEEEAAKFDSKFFRLVQRIKSPFGFWTKSISPKSLLDLPVPRQHGALVWRSICRSFSTCIPKQRRSERRPSASIASTTNLYSSTSYSLSSGSEPVRLHELQNDLKLTK
jgi:hypothetical protein